MVAHAFNLSTGEAEAGAFEASPVYKESSSIARGTQKNHALGKGGKKFDAQKALVCILDEQETGGVSVLAGAHSFISGSPTPWL